MFGKIIHTIYISNPKIYTKFLHLYYQNLNSDFNLFRIFSGCGEVFSVCLVSIGLVCVLSISLIDDSAHGSPSILLEFECVGGSMTAFDLGKISL